MKNYLIQLSNKTTIEIDHDDFEKVKRESASGNFIQLKQGIINPSFIVAIIPIEKQDTKKITGHIDETRGVYVVEKEEVGAYKLADAFKIEPKQLQ